MIYIKKSNKSVAEHVQILEWSKLSLNSSATHSVATTRDFIIDKKAIPSTNKNMRF